MYGDAHTHKHHTRRTSAVLIRIGLLSTLIRGGTVLPRQVPQVSSASPTDVPVQCFPDKFFRRRVRERIPDVEAFREEI